jgi:hypothetical protein
MAAAALGLALALCPHAFAATYTDEMANVYADQFREPFNMKYRHFVPGMPDYSVLTPAGKGPAYIDYKVADATEVTVYLYSRNGTFVKYDEACGKYRMGVYAQDMGLVEGQAPLPQAMLCPGSGEVYTLEGGLKWLIHDDFLGEYYFEERPGHAPPQGAPLGYGLNIYHSADGETFTRAQALISYLYYDINTSLFYEAYKAKVPAGARHIRVALNEMAKLRSTAKPEPEDYSAHSPLGETGLALAAMSVYGESLVVGVPDPIVLPEFPWEDYLRPQEASSQPARTIIYDYRERPREEASSKAPASQKEEPPEDAKEAPEPIPEEKPMQEPESAKSPSNFTGVIAEEPESPPRKAAEKQPGSVWLPDGEYWAAGQPLAQGPPATAPAAIEIAAAPREDTSFTKGVTAYIVLASGGLAALVLFKPK